MNVNQYAIGLQITVFRIVNNENTLFFFAVEFQIRVLIRSRDKRRKQEIIQMQKAMHFSAAVLNSVIYRNQISHCFRAC